MLKLQPYPENLQIGVLPKDLRMTERENKELPSIRQKRENDIFTKLVRGEHIKNIIRADIRNLN